MKRGLKQKKKLVVKKEEKSIIDRYGELNEMLKKLQKERDDLRKKILSYYGEGIHKGNNYTINVTKVVSPILSVVGVYKKLGLKKFLSVVSVSLEKVKQYLTSEEIEKLSEGERETFRVNVIKEKK